MELELKQAAEVFSFFPLSLTLMVWRIFVRSLRSLGLRTFLIQYNYLMTAISYYIIKYLSYNTSYNFYHLNKMTSSKLPISS